MADVIQTPIVVDGQPATGYRLGTPRPSLKEGDAWYTYTNTRGVVYFYANKASVGEAEKAKRQAIADKEANSQPWSEESLPPDRTPPAAAPTGGSIGEIGGWQAMQNRIAEVKESWSEVFGARVRVSGRLGPDIPGYKDNTRSATLVEVGGADLSADGVIKRGVSISTPSTQAGKLSATAEVGVDVEEGVTQSATRAVEQVVGSEAGQTARRLGDLESKVRGGGG